MRRKAFGATVVSGAKSSAGAQVRVTNTGNVESTGATTVSVYLSPDGLLADATLINTATASPKVPVGKSATIPVPYRLIPGVAAGRYEVIAQVTDSEGVSSVVNSGATVTVGVAAKVERLLATAVRGMFGR